ncbi:hypothetical protein ECA0486 [Pectobacterium atrosepticum SCRI1043]|uniref:Uncharacterized protein n=1 Tax=Pectobacterium atrosepticum (strain SCRI 1043 / ATCC BAA-672) TaxID=218491 RepID=Q6D9X7_PECAS|nr:hypothetical protein ECA0486 [Pectobacterium atrosepticum SCRI1043]
MSRNADNITLYQQHVQAGFWEIDVLYLFDNDYSYTNKLVKRHWFSHKRPAVGWSNSFPTNLSLSYRVIRPYGLTPSESAQALFKNALPFFSCNSNYLGYIPLLRNRVVIKP